MSGGGGILDICLENVIPDATDRENLNLQPGNYIRLIVKDTGRGIESDLHQRVFDPFFTTKKIGEGTGLGLSVVHGIVESHDGAIMMSSTPGKGTEFAIFLPVVEKDEDPEIAGISSHASPGNKDILFVDDEEALRDAGVRMLENMGYRVTAVSSGIEALDLVTNAPGKIDLVITDMTMPGMTGIELAQRLLDTQPDIPIILCTGYHETLSREKVRELGVREYLTKPYSLREIAGIIGNILD